MTGFAFALVLAVAGYVFALDQARRNSIREARLRTYAPLIDFISRFPISEHVKIKDPQGISTNKFIDELIKLIAPARLLSSSRTEIVLRDYYSEVSALCGFIGDGKVDKLDLTKVSQLALYLEESMRVDLGTRRFGSKYEFQTGSSSGKKDPDAKETT